MLSGIDHRAHDGRSELLRQIQIAVQQLRRDAARAHLDLQAERLCLRLQALDFRLAQPMQRQVIRDLHDADA